jgi:branched-chain amino acid transport system ATP-binding protein
MADMLRIDHLQACYGRAQALFDISLQVGEGEVVTLLGRNGMGRSTTIKCLFGLMPAKSGAIHFLGQRIDALPSYRIARCGLGLVPEGRQIFASLSVEENLVATARASGAKAWTLARAYELFPRLKERRQHAGSKLSGGEQQMLAIARALMTNPKLLVLDEATEGLAPIVRQEIWRALTMLKREGVSQIVIDKNIAPLLDLADRHYLVEKGHTVWSGSSAQLASEPELLRRHLGI